MQMKKRIVSGSSDCSIKIWDIGMQRCFKTYTTHDDSVWSLAIDPSFTRLFSAGRLFFFLLFIYSF